MPKPKTIPVEINTLLKWRELALDGEIDRLMSSIGFVINDHYAKRRRQHKRVEPLFELEQLCRGAGWMTHITRDPGLQIKKSAWPGGRYLFVTGSWVNNLGAIEVFKQVTKNMEEFDPTTALKNAILGKEVTI